MINVIRGIPLFSWALGLFYLVFIAIVGNSGLEGDETRYVFYAENISNGFYADPDNPSFNNGPGYPALLAPFVALHIPLIFAKLLNGIFVFIGLICFYRCLILLGVRKKSSTTCTVLLGLYPALIKWMPFAITEPVSFMLICAICYYLVLMSQKSNTSWKVWGVIIFLLGFLSLVKVLFAHIYIVAIIVGLLLLFIYRDEVLKKYTLATAGGLILFLPFVLYTWSLTGKFFLTGTQAGEILYHRATPYEGEYGDWIYSDYILEKKSEGHDLFALDSIVKHHKQFYLEVIDLPHLQRDSAFKATAIANMKAYPKKYLLNTVANVGRLLFSYPHTYQAHSLSTYGYLLPNAFLVVTFFYCLIIWFVSKQKLPISLLYMLGLTFVYLGAMIILGGRVRHFLIAVPPLLVFIAVVVDRCVRIENRDLW